MLKSITNYNNNFDQEYIIVGSFISNLLFFLVAIYLLYNNKYTKNVDTYYIKHATITLLVNSYIIASSIFVARYICHQIDHKKIKLIDFIMLVLIIQLVKTIITVKIIEIINNKFNMNLPKDEIKFKLFLTDTVNIFLSIIIASLLKNVK